MTPGLSGGGARLTCWVTIIHSNQHFGKIGTLFGQAIDTAPLKAESVARSPQSRDNNTPTWRGSHAAKLDSGVPPS